MKRDPDTMGHEIVILYFFSGRRQRHKYLALNAYDRHKILINEYLLTHPGATKILGRDTSKDKTDIDVVRENHRFLWDDVDVNKLTWEQRMAKKYYEKVVKIMSSWQGIKGPPPFENSKMCFIISSYKMDPHFRKYGPPPPRLNCLL